MQQTNSRAAGLARRVMRRWRETSADQRRVLRIVEAVVDRLGYLRLERFLRWWWVEVRNSQRMRGIMSVWLGRRVSQLLEAALNRWRKAVVKQVSPPWTSNQHISLGGFCMSCYADFEFRVMQHALHWNEMQLRRTIAGAPATSPCFLPISTPPTHSQTPGLTPQGGCWRATGTTGGEHSAAGTLCTS